MRVWATRNCLVFAQVKTQDKSNEITAIPSLLELFALKGFIVIIDVMGCQYKIADYIACEKADYVFSLKENQQSLYDDVAEYFKGTDFSHPASDVLVETTFDVSHGRLECRYYVSSLNSDFKLLASVFENWACFRKIALTVARSDS